MIAFNDLGAQYTALKDKMDKAVLKVLEDGKYIMGPEVSLLEKKLCEYVGIKHCITCSSGTDALLMPLMAWEIGERDAVFVPSFTFVSTAEVVSLAGGVPVFCDVKKDTFNIDPDSLEEAVKKVIADGKLYPRAVIAVDLFGLPYEYDRIKKICDKYGLLLIEDGAQGFGGEIGTRKACSFGDVSTTSFFPAKPLGCYGDGGALFTNDDNLASKLRSIRVHGKQDDENDPYAKYKNIRVGLSARLDTIQAAILSVKLDSFDDENEVRRNAAKKYTSLLKDTPLIKPTIPQGYNSSWAQYTLIAENSEQRKMCMDKLKENSIPSMIYYMKPLHLQPVFASLGYKEGSLPVSEMLSSCVFSLPMHGYISDETVQLVADVLNSCF